MSRKPSFATLRDRTAPAPVPVAAPTPAETGAPDPPRPTSCEVRKQIAGFLFPNMSLAMHMLARLQAAASSR